MECPSIVREAFCWWPRCGSRKSMNYAHPECSKSQPTQAWLSTFRKTLTSFLCGRQGAAPTISQGAPEVLQHLLFFLLFHLCKVLPLLTRFSSALGQEAPREQTSVSILHLNNLLLLSPPHHRNQNIRAFGLGATFIVQVLVKRKLIFTS